MPGPWTVRFASGPPLFHPSLGLLPGPPTALVPVHPGEPVLLVDDRNAGEHIRQGEHEAQLITTSAALALLAAHHCAVDDAAAVVFRPGLGFRRRRTPRGLDVGGGRRRGRSQRQGEPGPSTTASAG